MKVNQIISDNDNHMSIKGGIWVPKYSLTMSLFIEVSVLRRKVSVSIVSLCIRQIKD
jgi:hypothetical protein